MLLLVLKHHEEDERVFNTKGMTAQPVFLYSA